MRGEGITPGGFPRMGGPNRGGGGGDGRGMRGRAPVDQATRVEQIAKRRGITTEQASELFKQRQEKRAEQRRDVRKAARTERRVEQVSERRGISKEDAQKLIAERRAKRAERRAAQAGTPGQDGASMSREERIASRKKEFLSRIREKMGMADDKRAEFQERMKGRDGRRGHNNDMKGPDGPGNVRYRGGSRDFYQKTRENMEKRRDMSNEMRGPGGRFGRFDGVGGGRGVRRRMRGGQEQVGTVVGS